MNSDTAQAQLHTERPNLVLTGINCGRQRSWMIQKTTPKILYDNENIQVLSKGPYWACVWNSHGSNKYVDDSGFRDIRGQERRSADEIINSGDWEFFDVYIAHAFRDAMSLAWWQDGPHSAGAGSGAGCVHRLDKDTSGRILRAKTRDSFENLKSQVWRQLIKKKYVCLVHGQIALGEAVVIKNKLRHYRKRNETYVDEHCGDWAETHVSCLTHFASDRGRYSFCEVEILSGRTHQIRVHLENRGHPLVSDPKYNPILVFHDRQLCPRIFLHASSLRFRDGVKWQEVSAPLADDLQAVLVSLRVVRSSDEFPHLFQTYGGSQGAGSQDTGMKNKSQDSSSSPHLHNLEVDSETSALRAALRQDIIEALGNATLPLLEFSKNPEVRWKLRRLQCGGCAVEGDAGRLKAFVCDIASLSERREDGGSLSLGIELCGDGSSLRVRPVFSC